MNEIQFERLIALAERIAVALESITEHLESLDDCVDVVTHDDGGETSVFNIWNEGPGSEIEA